LTGTNFDGFARICQKNTVKNTKFIKKYQPSN